MSTIKSIFIQHLNGTTPNATMDTNGNFTVGGTVSGASSNMFRNRIINGAMVIDQRNAGASLTPTDGQFTVDRWQLWCSAASKATVQQSTTVPTGFKNSALITSSSSYSVGTSEAFSYLQPIEGLNVSDLGWGAAGALSVTLSFWVRSSLTGTFGGWIRNNGGTRSYVFSYTINAANTWEYKTVTITGDTTGTWLTTNGVGVYVGFSLGAGATVSTTAGSWNGSSYYNVTGGTSVVGTSGATWYVTGVQFEIGTAATPFEFRHFTTELQLCQRYFEMSYDAGYSVPGSVTEAGSIIFISPGNVNRFFGQIIHTVQKRATPTVTMYSTTGASGKIRDITASADMTVVNQVAFGRSGVAMVSSAGTTAASDSVVGHYTASAEL